MFFKRLIVSASAFRYKIYFEVVYVYNVRKIFEVHFFLYIQLLQVHLLERLICSVFNLAT